MDGLNSNILEQILKKLDNGKMILVLPEIVEKETVSNLEKVFIFLKHKKANTIFTKERFNDEKSKTNNLIDGIKDNLKAFFS